MRMPGRDNLASCEITRRLSSLRVLLSTEYGVGHDPCDKIGYVTGESDNV